MSSLEFVGYLAPGSDFKGAIDVEECDGGWLVACEVLHSVHFAGRDDAKASVSLGEKGNGVGNLLYPVSTTVVPGLGLLVREWGNGGCLQVFR